MNEPFSQIIGGWYLDSGMGALLPDNDGDSAPIGRGLAGLEPTERDPVVRSRGE